MSVVEDPLNRETIEAITQLIVERFHLEQIILFNDYAGGQGSETVNFDLLVVVRCNDQSHASHFVVD